MPEPTRDNQNAVSEVDARNRSGRFPAAHCLRPRARVRSRHTCQRLQGYVLDACNGYRISLAEKADREARFSYGLTNELNPVRARLWSGAHGFYKRLTMKMECSSIVCCVSRLHTGSYEPMVRRPTPRFSVVMRAS